MFIVYFLLTNVAVSVSGLSIIQLEDLDMLSSCHNGVLALDKRGAPWVIHNNGNETYIMTWDEYKAKWEMNRMKISDWKHSVNGTTIEWAAGSGSTKGDQFMDTCYNEWDVLVKYFADGNETLREPEQTCPFNKKYCGDDPETRAIGMTIPFTQPQTLLISCGDDGSIGRVDICDRNCTSRQDKPGNAHCECSPNIHLCGHQLHSLGWGPEYDNDTLYLCLDGINVSTVQRCSSGCLATGLGYICYGNCDPNKSFCGDKMMGLDSNTVYQCDASGRSVHIIANCSEACFQMDSENAACQCHPGRTYCAHELYTQMNWLGVKESYAKGPHQKAQCQSTKDTVIFGFPCRNCIASQGEKDAYCEWTAGVNCGRALNIMGFTGYEDDTLYQCGDEVGNTSIISLCLSSTCRDNVCFCIPGRTYCGHQLYWMAWSAISSDEAQGQLWECSPDGQHAKMISQCSRRCTSVDGRAKCACMDTEFYCGYELDGDPPDDDNGLYQCNNKGRANLIKSCNGSCKRVSEASTTDNFFMAAPACFGECIPGEKYCGSKLLKIGLTGYNNNSIYTCAMDGRIIDTGQLDTLCTWCKAGRTYCGHQLTKTLYLLEDPLQTLYFCERNNTYSISAPCTVCLNNSVGAYCQCIPGTQFCGRQIHAAGWLQFLENTNFTDDALFRCVDKEKIEVLEQCPTQQCRSIGDGISYCMCSPGRTYCGHQLDTHYNSPNTYLSMNSIYHCSDNQLWVDVIKECGTCVSINGKPFCREQCIHGNHYCGSDLLQLEGWNVLDIDPDGLYQCTNGSFASLEINCTAGCHAKIGDADAYCLGMPMAWYWIFMAVTLPLLFISLCLWLIRTIRKQRGLQKFIQQHRINGSQLTLVQKLGQGQFGEVWQSRYTDQSGQQMDVAIKISKHHLNASPGQNLASANCFFQESVALDFLRHQNITRALGICSNLKMAGGITCPALVLEYMDGGNSADYILKEREHLQTSDLMRIFIDICQAGEHLQKMGVIHRDIGARNVLIRKHPRNGKPAVAKLTDFGLAKDIGKTGIYKSTIADRAMFHEGYTAPEGFRGEFSSQSDVWSFGVFMWELYMLIDKNQTEPVTPYSDISSQDILIEIGNGYRLRRPQLAPTEIYSTMTSCWTWIPEARPTFRQLRKILQTKRIHKGVEEPVLELDPERCGHEAIIGEERKETAFSEQSAKKYDGYGSPR